MVKRVLSKKQLNALAKGRATRANNIRLRKKSSNKYGGAPGLLPFKLARERRLAPLARGLAIVADNGSRVVEYITNPGTDDRLTADGLRLLEEALESVLSLVKSAQGEPEL